MLAAGAYGSPGDPPAQRHRAGRGLPVGEGLVDHVGVGLGSEPSDVGCSATLAAFERATRAVHGAGHVASASGLRARPLRPLPRSRRRAREQGWEVSAAVFAMKPRSRGTVRLARRDPPRRSRSTTASSPTPATPTCSPRASSGCGSSPTARRRALRGARVAGRAPGRRGTHVRATGAASSTRRDVRHRPGRRRRRPRPRARRAGRRRRLDHADDPAREHAPDGRSRGRAAGRAGGGRARRAGLTPPIAGLRRTVTAPRRRHVGARRDVRFVAGHDFGHGAARGVAFAGAAGDAAKEVRA